MSRPLVLPPEEPVERVTALRAAFERMVRDPAYLAEMDRINDFYDAYAIAVRCEVAVVAGDPGAGALIEHWTTVAQENSWAAACLDRARGRLDAANVDVGRRRRHLRRRRACQRRQRSRHARSRVSPREDLGFRRLQRDQGRLAGEL